MARNNIVTKKIEPRVAPKPAVKPSAAVIKENLTNYVSTKQGLMGEAVRAIKKHQDNLSMLIGQMDE